MQHSFSPVITRLIIFFAIVLQGRWRALLAIWVTPSLDYPTDLRPTSPELGTGRPSAEEMGVDMLSRREGRTTDAVPLIRTRMRNDLTFRESTRLWDNHARRTLIGDPSSPTASPKMVLQ